MKTKNNREIKRAIILLAFIALSVAMSGCGGGSSSNNSAATPNVNRDTPQNTQAQQTPTPNPTDAFAGVWETKDPRATSQSAGTTGYVRWQISPGTQKGEQYTGKITDLSDNNKDVADYVLGPKNNITLEFSPAFSGGPSLGGSRTYEYEVSDNGNTITLKADKPIVLKRGSSNTDILKDAQAISSGNSWKLDPDVASKIFPSYDKDRIYAEFETPNKYNEGYGGSMKFTEDPPPGVTRTPANVADWRYTITSRNKVDINDGKGTKSASYELLNNDKILKIDFADDTPDLYLTR
jgi:hypothetical protein